MSVPAKIVRRGGSDVLLAAEALAWLALFRLALALVPVRRILRAVTHGRAEARMVDPAATEFHEQNIPSDASLKAARRVRWAVSAAARHSMVRFVCFPQTLAGHTMLRLRGVASVIVYGVARSEEGELQAHTWLLVEGRTVLGGEDSAGFTPIEQWT